MLSATDWASASSSSRWSGLTALLMVTVFSMNSAPFNADSSLRISPAAVGAQLPFSISAKVRFCRLWFTMSCTRFSMPMKMPAL